MADIFEDMGDTVGALPPDASDRPEPLVKVPPSAGQRPISVPTNSYDLAKAKQEADAALKLMGTSLAEEEAAASLAKRQELVKQVYKDAEKNAPLFEKIAKKIDSMDNNIVTRTIKNTVGETINVSAGVALGAQNAFYSGVNAFKEGYNAVGKLAKDHGLVDSFDPTGRIDFSKFQDQNYPETTKVVANIGQSISPAIAAAGVAAVSTPLAAVVAAGAATYLLLDPKSTGLAEFFKDTAVGKTLMLDEAFKYSEKKPDDTEIEGRLKNVLDYTFGEALIGGAILGIRKMYQAGKKVVPYLKATDNVAKEAETVAPKAQAAVEGTPAVKVAKETAITKVEEPLMNQGVEVVKLNTPEFEAMLDKQVEEIIRNSRGAPLGLDPGKTLEQTLKDAIRRPGELAVKAARTPLTDDELVEAIAGYEKFNKNKDSKSISIGLDYYTAIENHANIMGFNVEDIVDSPNFGGKTFASLQSNIDDAPVMYQQYTFDNWIESLNKPEKPPVMDVTPEEMLKADPSLSAKRPAQTIPGMIAEGKKRQETDGWFKKLLDDRKADPTQPLSAEDSLALDIEGLRAQVTAKNAASKALATGDPLDVMAAQEALDYQIKVLSVKEAAASEAGRTLGITEGIARAIESGNDAESIKLGLEILGSKGRAKLLQKYLDTYGGVRPIQERLKMIEMLNEIPDAKFANDELRHFNTMKKVIKQTGFRKFTDAAYSVWTSAVLTPKTAANVWLLNNFTTAMQAFDNYSAALIGKLPKIGGGSTFAEANAFASGVADSFYQGHKVGVQALIEGRPPRGYTVNGDFSTIAKDADTAGANSVWGWLYQKGMSMATATGRLVMSADVVSKYINETAFIKQYAVEEAIQMADRMGIQVSERSAYITKYVNDVIENPSQSMMNKAKDMAEKLTQSRNIDNVPVLGSMQNALEEDPTGLLRFMFPFFRTSTNTLLNAIEYAPVLNLTLKETRQALLAGGKARDMALAKAMNGSLFTIGVYKLYDSGILHGEMPNPKQQQALADGGKGVTPYTLDLTSMGLGAYYIRPIDPVGKALRLAALYSTVSHGNQDLETSDYIHAIGAMAFSQVTPESMQTINAVVDAVNGKDTKALTNLLQTTLANTVVPLRGTVKQISNAAIGLYNEDGKFDMRQPKGAEEEFMGMFKAQLKDTIGYGLPPKRDIFGEPIKAHWLTAISPWPSIDTENSPIGKKLRILSDFEGHIRRSGFTPSFSIEMPEASISSAPSGISVKLTPDEYDDLIVQMNKIKLNGKDLKQAVDADLSLHMKDLASAGLKSYLNQSEKEAVYKAVINKLDDTFKLYEDMARKSIEASPDVQRRINDAVKKSKPLDMSGLNILGGN